MIYDGSWWISFMNFSTQCFTGTSFRCRIRIGRWAGLSGAETFELLVRYRTTDDRSARERAIEQNLPLVRALARRFSRSAEQTEELVQAGSIGLIKAVDGFDAARGRDLGAYAVPTIVGELRRQQSRAARASHGGRPGPVVTALDESSVEALGSELELRRTETRAALRAAFRTLTRREREVVALRFYRDLTQERIAAELGLSQAQVSRVLSAALRKLRQVLVEP
jgi:RNA polymerase sigma factor (sigma-70 family)